MMLRRIRMLSRKIYEGRKSPPLGLIIVISAVCIWICDDNDRWLLSSWAQGLNIMLAKDNRWLLSAKSYRWLPISKLVLVGKRLAIVFSIVTFCGDALFLKSGWYNSNRKSVLVENCVRVLYILQMLYIYLHEMVFLVKNWIGIEWFMKWYIYKWPDLMLGVILWSGCSFLKYNLSRLSMNRVYELVLFLITCGYDCLNILPLFYEITNSLIYPNDALTLLWLSNLIQRINFFYLSLLCLNAWV